MRTRRLERSSETMEKIKKSSDETAKIMKMIDAIAFPTNLPELLSPTSEGRQ